MWQQYSKDCVCVLGISEARLALTSASAFCEHAKTHLQRLADCATHITRMFDVSGVRRAIHAVPSIHAFFANMPETSRNTGIHRDHVGLGMVGQLMATAEDHPE